MGTSRRCIPRILACHCSQSCCCCFFAVRVIIGVFVIVLANANTAAQGQQGCQLAIVTAILCLVVAVVVLVSTIAIAWDDNNELPVILLCLVQFFLCVGEIGKVTPPLTLSSCLRYVGVLLGGDRNCPQKLWCVNTKN
jgi:hypothetical protein